MKKLLVFLCASALVFGAVGVANVEATTMVADLSFDDNAFADALPDYSNVVVFSAFAPTPTISDAITDIDVSTGVRLGNTTAGSVKLRFTDNVVVNLGSFDLALFEIGGGPSDLEYFKVTIAGSTVDNITLTTTPYLVGPLQWNIRYALIDLAAFGVADFGTIDEIIIAAGSWSNLVPGGGAYSELALVGGLHSTPVPEPTTLLLLGIGLIGLAGFSRRKFFK